MIIYESPSVISIDGHDEQYEQIKKFLTYHSVSAQFLTKKFKNAIWFVNKHGREAYEEKLLELKEQEYKTLLWEEGGKILTYSGLAKELAFKLNTDIVNNLSYPEFKTIPWNKVPEIELRYYQTKAIDLLLLEPHANVSLPTGSGKSACILFLMKKMGLKTTIMAPSVSIATQLYNLFKDHFGDRYVGMYGNGKKKLGKLFTVAIAQSLSRVKEDTKEWEDLSKTQVFIADESHLCPAETLKSVCMGLFGQSPYRYFFSATQMRNDGADLLLDGIIGKCVMEMSEKDLIDQGFLAKPTFLLVNSYSSSNYTSKDSLRMLSAHLYNNAALHKKVAEMANRNVESLNHKVLIMIDQICQFKYLYPYLKHKVEFAHGGLGKDKDIPEKFHNKKPQDLVDAFNRGEIPILVGTSCISIGTDIKPVDTIFNLQGGKSEVKFKQLIGRGTRTTKTKKEFFFIDFDIANIPQLHNHSLIRKKIYKDFYNNYKVLDI